MKLIDFMRDAARFLANKNTEIALHTTDGVTSIKGQVDQNSIIVAGRTHEPIDDAPEHLYFDLNVVKKLVKGNDLLSAQFVGDCRIQLRTKMGPLEVYASASEEVVRLFLGNTPPLRMDRLASWSTGEMNPNTAAMLHYWAPRLKEHMCSLSSYGDVSEPETYWYTVAKGGSVFLETENNASVPFLTNYTGESFAQGRHLYTSQLLATLHTLPMARNFKVYCLGASGIVFEIDSGLALYFVCHISRTR